MKNAIERVEAHGLYVNSFVKDGVRRYYVSIDQNNGEPTDEQDFWCHFQPTPEKAAATYIRENPDHF